jgi:salicylate hydroxylase
MVGDSLGDALAEVGARIGEGSAYYRMDGTFVSRVVTTDSSGWNGIYGMHRADLLRVLAAGLPSTAIRWGHRCIAFEQRDFVVRLNFATGQTDTADVVVAADGIQSSLQEYVVEPSTPEYSGSRAYRGLIPKEKVPE